MCRVSVCVCVTLCANFMTGEIQIRSKVKGKMSYNIYEYACPGTYGIFLILFRRGIFLFFEQRQLARGRRMHNCGSTKHVPNSTSVSSGGSVTRVTAVARAILLLYDPGASFQRLLRAKRNGQADGINASTLLRRRRYRFARRNWVFRVGARVRFKFSDHPRCSL